MVKVCINSSVPVRGLLLSFGILLLLPTWGRAADMSFDGGGGCSDPPIFSEIFTLGPVSAGGGMCKHFGNHSSKTFTSLSFTTTFPDKNAGTDPFLCSGGTTFANCDFIVDGRKVPSGTPISSGLMIIVEFFGIDATHPGIPSLPPGTPDTVDNFFLNLNNPDPATGLQPFDDSSTAPGDWITGRTPNTFAVVANAPEPGTWILLLAGLGALLARTRLARNVPGS